MHTTALMTCSDCALAVINGVPCHETGCPSRRKHYDATSGEWVRLYECGECGSMHDDVANASLCCAEDYWTDSDEGEE